jgi:hypothetical protein
MAEQNKQSNPQSNTITKNENTILQRLNETLQSGFNNIKQKINNKPDSSNKSKTKTNSNSNPISNSKLSYNSIIENITPDMENYTIVLGVFLAFIILFGMFFISKTFNVGRTVERIKMYERYQKITNYQYRNKSYGSLTLKDVSILSSYNSCLNNGQMLTYTSENILKQIIKSGARFVEFNVFSSKFGVGGKPVISNGYKRGEWKLTLNSVPFENVVATLKDNAFKTLSTDGGAPNPNDPLFISLNLSTGYNIYCLDLMADILLDYFNERLLDPKYAFQFSNNIHDIKMTELENKVVIFASNGFEGSKLEELVNGVWLDETNIKGTNPNLMNLQETFMSKNKSHKTSKRNVSTSKANLSKTKTKSRSTFKDTDNKNDKKNNNVANALKKDSNINKREIVDSYSGNKPRISPDELDDSISHLQQLNIDDNKLQSELNKELYKSSSSLGDNMTKDMADDMANIDEADELGTKDKQEKFMSKLDNLYTIFESKTKKEKFNNDNEDNTENTDTDANTDTDDNTDNDNTDTEFAFKAKSKIVRITSQMFSRPEFNGDRIKAHNKSGITIVVPNIEGDLFNKNHDPTEAFKLGCQFVCMNFQYVNESMDTYITKFEKKGIMPLKELVN